MLATRTIGQSHGRIGCRALAMVGMEATVTRGTAGKPDVPKMSPEQALTVGEAIEAYTINVAWSLLIDRLGAGYEFHLRGHFSLAPEFFVDLIESGENTWVAGVALGYEF